MKKTATLPSVTQAPQNMRKLKDTAGLTERKDVVTKEFKKGFGGVLAGAMPTGTMPDIGVETKMPKAKGGVKVKAPKVKAMTMKGRGAVLS